MASNALLEVVATVFSLGLSSTRRARVEFVRGVGRSAGRFLADSETEIDNELVEELVNHDAPALLEGISEGLRETGETLPPDPAAEMVHRAAAQN